MPTIHALFVAINQYHSKPLKGCVNDLNAFRAYLEDYCANNSYLLNSKTLLDSSATRNNIISSFQHFQEAKPEDTCLFFFAGHGSHYAVPPAFTHLEPDGELETIVCYDSRLPGGHDLVDKELSYLIWEVSHLTTAPFISVMDCCHSGTFRAHHPEEVTIRELSRGMQAMPPDQFYGYSNYKREGNGRVTPPLARRVHLGAARDLETAKEVRVDGIRRGIFTESLVSVLKKTNAALSYRELIKRINHIVRRAVSDQAPQLMVTETDDKNLLFLTTTVAPTDRIFLVGHTAEYGWTVDVGAIYGIPHPDENQTTKFQLLADKQELEVVKVLPHLSVVRPMEGYNKSKTYAAALQHLGKVRFKIAFSADVDQLRRQLLEDRIKQNGSDIFALTTNAGEADFLLQAKNQAYSIYRTQEEQNIGWPLPIVHEDTAIAFLDEVEKILKWYQVLQLDNPSTTIRDAEIKLDLSRTTDAGYYENDVKLESIDLNNPALLKYLPKNGIWHKPAFQLKIKNTGNRRLFVSLIYLGNNFGISNQLIQMQLLDPGHEVYALDHADGQSYLTIPVEVKDFYLHKGIETVEDFLKVIFSTEPFETTNFNQDGINWSDPSRGEVHRVMALRGSMQGPDWRCWTIPLLVHRPKESV